MFGTLLLFLGFIQQISAQRTFIHPGGLHTVADLERMKTKVAANESPWIDGFNALVNSGRANSTWGAEPHTSIGGNDGIRQRAELDAHVAYNNTLRWYITGDTQYAECAVRIINAWTNTVTSTNGELFQLATNNFMQAAELLRTYPGWKAADINKVKVLASTIFYPACHDFLNNCGRPSSWDAPAVSSMLIIGVFCDDEAIYNEAITYYKTGAGTGSLLNTVTHPSGQILEMGRDMVHANIGLSCLGEMAQTAFNQGDESLYSYSNNRLLAGYEYYCKYNLNHPVVWEPTNNCNNENFLGISYYNQRGFLTNNPTFEMVYNHYAVLKGLDTPWLKSLTNLARVETSNDDFFGYGTLAYTRNAAASPYPAYPIPNAPTGVTAMPAVGKVYLSWTGPSGDVANGYNILRSTASNGVYTSIYSSTRNTLTTYTDRSIQEGITYYYKVSANNQSGTSGNSNVASAKQADVTTALPTGWVNTHIGLDKPEVTTTASYTNAVENSFIVIGSGNSITESSDNTTFTYGKVTGDFTFTTHVADYKWAWTWDRAGIMIRESLDPNSKALSIGQGGDPGARFTNFLTRSNTGGTQTTIGGNKFSFSPWYRLQRTGNTFTAYQSTDGITYSIIGTSTITMNNSCYIGFFVCSGSLKSFSNITFENATIEGGGSLPSISSSLTGITLSSSKIKLEWTTSEATSAYNLKRSTAATGPYTTIATGITGTSYTDKGLEASTTYYYELKSTNIIGESTDSATTSMQTSELLLPETPMGVNVTIGNAKVSLSWGATDATVSYNVMRSTVIDGTYTLINSVTSPSFIDETVNNNSTYYYKIISTNSIGNSPATEAATAIMNTKFTGTTIGTDGSWNNNPNNTKSAAMDNNLDTYFDANITDGAWVGIDLGANNRGKLASMSFAPRSNTPQRMIGGIFQGANNADFSDATTFYTISNSPVTGLLTNQTIPDTRFFRYFRYLSPKGASGNVAEIEFWGTIVNSLDQTITFNAIETKEFGDVDFDPGASTSSGLSISYSSSDTSIATIVNGKVRLVSTGTATITAIQAGNDAYWPAQSQSRALTVNIKNDTQLTTLIGKPFTYTISNKTLSNFTATGLPEGLSVDSITGIISGTPTQFGDFSVTITASNGSNTGSQIITLTVQNIVASNLFVASGDAKNIIEWDPIQNFSYNIKRATASGGPYTTIENTTDTKFTDTTISNGTIYYYVVSSVDGTTENSNSTEVTATPNTGQIAYLKFDETSGIRSIDNWGAKHGTLAATATRTAGKYSQSIKLDGTANSFATLPTGIVSTLNDFTISTWVRMDAKATWMRVFDFGISSVTPTSYMFLTIQAGTNLMRYAIRNGGSEQLVSATYTLALNTWTHFAITQSGNTASMYINGALVATNTGVTIKPSTMGSTDRNYLGKSQFSADAMFKGSIDEFKIYSRALSASEIAQSAKLNQTITLKATLQKEIVETDFEPAQVTSGLSITYSSSDESVASIVDGKLHIVAPGTSTITASQAGNTDYNSAQTRTQILTVVKREQTVSFDPIETKTLGDGDFNGSATASSNLTVSYSSSNPDVAIIVDGKIHLVGAGTSIITASQTGNDIYNQAVEVSQTLTIITSLKVKHQDGDNNLTNNTIKPNLTIYNEGSVAVPYNELTLRYWITPENYAGINNWIDYAQLGNNKVKIKYVALPEPRNGAYGYIEYGFQSTAGNLLAGTNSGLIQSRFANSNWSNLNENDDYSHANASTFEYNDHITMYRNGQLVWGIEPLVTPPVVNLKVYTETKSSATTNSISTYLKINNEGNVPLAYGDVKVRYWFTKEGMANLNYYLDYAVLGNSNIESGFVTLNPAQNAADTYLELGVKSSLGTFYPSSSTGNIQYRITKSDWTNFNQVDDYSYNSNETIALNDRVTVYYQGQLIYGTEPLINATSKIAAADKSLIEKNISRNQLEQVIVYPNPVTTLLNIKVNEVHSDATIELYNSLGMKVHSQTLKNTSEVLYVDKLPSGMYLLNIKNGTEITLKKILKK